jgi:hypothetical protein
MCVCVAFFGFFGLTAWIGYQSGMEGSGSFGLLPESTPVVIRPTPGEPMGGTGQASPASISDQTLTTLEKTNVPVADMRDLASRLEGKEGIPLTVAPPVAPLTVGTQSEFWVTNTDTNENFKVSATLRYLTEHSYFWVQDEIKYDEADLKNLAETFEQKIYLTTRAFFGSEWTPGVDGDPHLYILYAEGLGSRLAGYFSSADENHPLAHEYSNAHEMFLLNEDSVDLAEESAYSVLAHEFQHMIHWNRDRNETSWMNEGFSELAAFLNGYDVGSEFAYISNPDIQLNDWPNNQRQTLPHYGAGFLFMTYFLDRFGEAATQELVGNPLDDLESVDAVLAASGAKDALTGSDIIADDVFLDWVLANFLKDQNISDGRYTYSNYPGAPQADTTETIRHCPTNPITRDVHQYGVDYIQIACRGSYTLHFEGSVLSRIVPTDFYSGSRALWSNKGDESDMTLTQTFDFSDQEGPLSLSYWTWYDLEEDYDYLYLEVSEDGEHWQILTTPSGTPEDPSGNSYGWGYNGKSQGWIQERIDLSPYAGKKVQLRFEYVTDAAVNGEGMLLDDISIPEIGYLSDFENDSGGWEADGWVRIENILPQTFRLALISLGQPTTVTYLPIKPDVTADIPLELDEDVVVVVTGTTRFTREKAAYRLEIRP